MGMEEKRRSKRMELKVQISLRAIDADDDDDSRTYDVELVNISKGGMAFKCEEDICINGFYDAQITLWTKEKISAVVQVLRKNRDGAYGGKFVGISSADLFKIEVYEMFNYPDEETQ